MKIFSIVMKVVVALAAVAGAVYLAATYGDKIVAWAKKTLGSCKCCECECECCEEAAEEVVEEEAAEAPAEEGDVVAAEADFEG
jgi:hypothetical protein